MSATLLLTFVLIGAALAAVAIGVLIREGFRDGDVGGDVRVRARTLAPAWPGAAGRWVEVTFTNPSTGTALVALSLRPTRAPWLGTTARRHTGRRRERLSLGERSLGTVPGEGSAALQVWAEGELRRLRLLVAVGTAARLRLHRLPLPEPEPGDVAGAGTELPDPREPVAP